VWNIGAEGQYVMGAVFAAGMALTADSNSSAWMVVAVLLGLLGGILVAGRGQQLRKKGVDSVLKGVLMGIVAVPSLVLGPLLLLVFAIWLGWLPLGGNGAGVLSLILPSVTLGLGMGAALAGLLAESIEEELGRDYVRTVTAKGGSVGRAWGHVLANSLIPFTILMCLQMGVVLTGVVLTEVVFGWPGVGSLLVALLHAAFTGAGGRAEYVAAPAYGADGHGYFGAVGSWQGRVDAFLRQTGAKR
jgi:peptide/nickel transport system permease protein